MVVGRGQWGWNLLLRYRPLTRMEFATLHVRRRVLLVRRGLWALGQEGLSEGCAVWDSVCANEQLGKAGTGCSFCVRKGRGRSPEGDPGGAWGWAGPEASRSGAGGGHAGTQGKKWRMGEMLRPALLRSTFPFPGLLYKPSKQNQKNLQD